MTVPEGKPEIMHQPQGKLCATCVRQHDDCSDLNFDMMRVIGRLQNVVIVRCDNWKKK